MDPENRSRVNGIRHLAIRAGLQYSKEIEKPDLNLLIFYCLPPTTSVPISILSISLDLIIMTWSVVHSSAQAPLKVWVIRVLLGDFR